MISLVKIMNSKFEKIDKRFDKMDERLDKMINILHQHGERLASIEAYIHYREERNSTGTEK